MPEIKPEIPPQELKKQNWEKYKLKICQAFGFGDYQELLNKISENKGIEKEQAFGILIKVQAFWMHLTFTVPVLQKSLDSNLTLEEKNNLLDAKINFGTIENPKLQNVWQYAGLSRSFFEETFTNAINNLQHSFDQVQMYQTEQDTKDLNLDLEKTPEDIVNLQRFDFDNELDKQEISQLLAKALKNGEITVLLENQTEKLFGTENDIKQIQKLRALAKTLGYKVDKFEIKDRSKPFQSTKISLINPVENNPEASKITPEEIVNNALDFIIKQGQKGKLPYRQDRVNSVYLRGVFKPDGREPDTKDIVKFFQLAIKNPKCEVMYKGKVIKNIECEKLISPNQGHSYNWEIDLEFTEGNSTTLLLHEFYNVVLQNGEKTNSRNTEIGCGGVYLEFINEARLTPKDTARETRAKTTETKVSDNSDSSNATIPIENIPLNIRPSQAPAEVQKKYRTEKISQISTTNSSIPNPDLQKSQNPPKETPSKETQNTKLNIAPPKIPNQNNDFVNLEKLDLTDKDNCKLVVYYAAEIYNQEAIKRNLDKNSKNLEIIQMSKNTVNNKTRFSGIDFDNKPLMKKIRIKILSIYHPDYNKNAQANSFCQILNNIFDQFETNNFKQKTTQNHQSNYYSSQNPNHPNYRGGFTYERGQGTESPDFSDIFESFFRNYEPKYPFVSEREMAEIEKMRRQEQQKIRDLDNKILQLSKDFTSFFVSSIGLNSNFGSLQNQKNTIDNFLRLSLNSHDLQTKTDYYNLALTAFENMKRSL